jgi:hypothetical protein
LSSRLPACACCLRYSRSRCFRVGTCALCSDRDLHTPTTGHRVCGLPCLQPKALSGDSLVCYGVQSDAEADALLSRLPLAPALPTAYGNGTSYHARHPATYASVIVIVLRRVCEIASCRLLWVDLSSPSHRFCVLPESGLAEDLRMVLTYVSRGAGEPPTTKNCYFLADRSRAKKIHCIDHRSS